MDPAVIAGVLSRESQGGNFVVDMGNMGNGIGVIQVMLLQSRCFDAGKTAQQAKYFLEKRENLGSDLQHPFGKPAMVVCACNLKAVFSKWRQVDSWSLLASQMNQ